MSTSVHVLLVAVLVFSVYLSGGDCQAKQQRRQLAERRWLAKRAIDWSGMYLPTHVNKSSSCGRAVEAMFDSFTKNETWAAEMVDSWGKTSSGILYGNSYYPGVFDQCLNVKSPDNAIHGKYCVINIRKASHKKTVHHINLPVTLEHLGLTPFIINDKVTSGTFFRYATCIPDVCSTEELWASLVQEYSEKDYNLLYTFCQPDEMFTAFTTGDIAFIAVVSILFSLMLAAGIVDVYIQNTNNKTLAKGGLKYLLPFSVYTNTQKLFELNTKSSPGTISCLHGIKVLSMTWVIFGHQQSASLQLNANTQDMWKRVNKFLYQAIANAYFSVDTFFMVGGLLLSCSAFRQLKRTGKFNVALFFLHRLVRLVPAIAIVAGLYATVVHFFMSGFFADFWHYWEATCSQVWWRDILFINNFVNEPVGLGLGGDCLGQCWYLAVDTQLYLVAPLIFLPLYYYAPVGKVWMYVLCVLSIYIPAQIIYTYDLPPSSFLVARNADVYFNKVYLTPWCRAGPWLVGIWLGYIMYTQDHKRVVLKKWQVVGGWTAAVCTGVLLVFGVWSYNTVPPKADYDIVTQVVYGGLQRFMWGVVMAWIIYACHYGAGGLVNDFLAHPIWQPLSRLTYTMYLVTLTMQFAIVYQARVPYYYSYISLIMETVGVMVISFFVAVLVSLSVESPIIGLERILLGRPDRETVAPTSSTPENGAALSLVGRDNSAFTSEMKEMTPENKDTGSIDNVYMTKL